MPALATESLAVRVGALSAARLGFVRPRPHWLTMPQEIVGETPLFNSLERTGMPFSCRGPAAPATPIRQEDNRFACEHIL